MHIMFDVEAIMADPTLNTLNWEIIEARGIPCGDLMVLWQTALDMAESCAECSLNAHMWIIPDDEGETDPVSAHIAATYDLLSKFMARESREIVKFLQLRGFEFPSGRTGKRPPDAMGI